MNIIDLYADIEKHLLEDSKPSAYLNEIYDSEFFTQHPFFMLRRLKNTEQSPKHHPEGDVWNHTMLVVNEAAKRKSKSKDVAVFMWAALLHDIGKPTTTKKRGNKITAYDHDKAGERLAKKFLSTFTHDEHFINAVAQLVRYHMQILFVTNNMPLADIQGMRKNTDIYEVALLGLCDRLGRKNCDMVAEERNIEMFLRKCDTFRSAASDLSSKI